MESETGNRGVSEPGETASRRIDEAHAEPVADEDDDKCAFQEGDLDDAGCVTGAYFNRVLPPIPQWMREPPKPKVPTLFDDPE